MSKRDNEYPVCSACKSKAVTIDADASWDMEQQEWRLGAVFDTPRCHDCDGECSLEWRTEPDTPHAFITIHHGHITYRMGSHQGSYPGNDVRAMGAVLQWIRNSGGAEATFEIRDERGGAS